MKKKPIQLLLLPVERRLKKFWSMEKKYRGISIVDPMDTRKLCPSGRLEIL